MTAYLPSIPNLFLWFRPSPSEELKSALQAYNFTNSKPSFSENPLFSAVIYLADHSDSKLEEVVKRKLTEAKPEQRKTALSELGTFAHQSENNRMLKVCKRIVDLNLLKTTFAVANVPELAEFEATYTPEPVGLIQVISNPLLHNWKRHRHYFGKILNLVVAVPMGILTNTASNLFNVLHTPPSTIMEIQGYIFFYTSCYQGYQSGKKYFFEYFTPYFSSVEKAYAAAAAIIVSFFALNYIKNWFRLGLTDDTENNGGFENLNLLVKAGLIEPTEARTEEKKNINICWAESSGKKYRIAMLTGPTGSGKTQLVEGIAWDAENNKDSPYFGKTVYRINTALVAAKPSYLIQKLEMIKGHEEDVIIFFDEAHSAGGQQGRIGSLLQIFKTKLPQNIRVCFATTKIEYDQYIKPDAAFIDRVKEIEINPLPDSDTRFILKNTTKRDGDQSIEVDESAYGALLKVASTDPLYIKKANPRKSLQLLRELSNTVFQWTPSLLSKELDQETREEKTALDKIRQDSLNDAYWITREEDRAAVTALKEKRKSIQELRERIAVQKLRLEKIRRLQKLQMSYRKQKNELIHILATNPHHQKKAEKNFLMLKFMLLPQVQQALRNEANSFEEAYQEKVPLVLDAEWIKGKFPACFPTKPLELIELGGSPS